MLPSVKTKKLKQHRVKMPKTFEERHMGTEPVGNKTAIESQGELVKLLNWYNYFQDSAKAKSYVIEANKDLADKLKNVPDNELRTHGWIFRLIKRDFIMPVETMDRVKRQINELVTKYDKKSEIDGSSVRRMSPQDYIKRRNNDLVADLEDEVDKYIRDNKYEFDAYKWLRGKEVNHIAAKAVMDRYSEWAKEDKFIKKIYDAAFSLAANAKVIRKRRAKKPVTAESLTKKFQYKKEDTALQLVSISPADLIGASEAFVYNTEKRILTHYVGELTVKGTTIVGFDETKSVSKRIRKPEVTIKELKNSSKLQSRKVIEKLTTKPMTVNGRTNGDVVLMKVYRK